MTRASELKIQSGDVTITEAHIKKLIRQIKKGLSSGLKNDDGQVCIEAAVSLAIHPEMGVDDQPPCVAGDIRELKIELNDSGDWEDEMDRAKGLLRLGIVQLGTANMKKKFDADRIANDLLTRYSKKRELSLKLEARKCLEKYKTPSVESSLDTWQIWCMNVNDVHGGLQGAFGGLPVIEDFAELNHDELHNFCEDLVQEFAKAGAPGAKFLYLTKEPKRRPEWNAQDYLTGYVG